MPFKQGRNLNVTISISTFKIGLQRAKANHFTTLLYVLKLFSENCELEKSHTIPNLLTEQQHLHRFRQDKATVHTLCGHESHLIGAGIQFIQAAEGAVLTVSDPVIFEITKKQYTLTERKLYRSKEKPSETLTGRF